MRDHKLVKLGKGLPAEDIKQFYVGAVGEKNAEIILAIHDNCSWSKKDTSIATEHNTLRLILQDADWIEGMILQRCLDYTASVGAAIPADVVRHIHEKLKLIPAGLTFDSSRQIAEERGLMKILTDYLELNEEI